MNTHSKCFLTERYNIKDAIYILNRHHWIKIHRFIQESVEPPQMAVRGGGTPQKVDNSGYVSGCW